MKANKKIYQTIILVLSLNIAFEIKAQTDQAFDKLYPKSLVDERKPVCKIVYFKNIGRSEEFRLLKIQKCEFKRAVIKTRKVLMHAY